jgi:hypothetical protein
VGMAGRPDYRFDSHSREVVPPVFAGNVPAVKVVELLQSYIQFGRTVSRQRLAVQ